MCRGLMTAFADLLCSCRHLRVYSNWQGQQHGVWCSPGASVPSGKKKKNGEELAREVLAHFEMTVRSFYASLAKAIHQYPRRRGDESVPVSGPMRSCALYLGLVMKSSFEKLTLREDPETASQVRPVMRIFW